jgi:hypothetical protein
MNDEMGSADVGDTTQPNRWDRDAIRDGATVAVTFAVPFTLIARIAFDNDAKSGWAALLALASFAGFVLGAGVAAWRQDRGTPLSHALVTSVGVFVSVQVTFSVFRLLTGDGVNIGRIVVSLTLTVLAGLVGGFLGSFMQRQGVRPTR